MFGHRHILHISKKTCLEKKFSSIFNKSVFSNQLKSKEPSIQASKDNHTIETILPVGWAGQPIVQRLHPILPELPGDIADTIKTVQELNKLQDIRPISIHGTEDVSAKRDTLPIEAVDLPMELATKTKEEAKSKPNCPEDDIMTDEVKSRVRSHDTISLLHEDINKSNNSAGENSISKMKTIQSTNTFNSPIQPTNIDKKIRKYIQGGLPKRSIKPKFTVKKSKKIKKKTKIMLSKGESKTSLNGLSKVNKSAKSIKLNKKPSIPSQFLLNQRGYTLNAIPKGFLLMENRQFATDCKFPPCARKANGDRGSKSDCAFPPCGKPGKQGKISKKVAQDEEGKYPDDCKCPTLAESKFRVDTKICGEAKGTGLKKDAKKRKMKMCLVENKIQHRKSTFVCKSAAFERARKKRNLPKCPPPEKKVAARALICPPNLEDEEAKAQVKCVKQVEEVKVRARTKVCKPIIIHAKEEVSLKIEKAVCVEKKTKQVVSRHTSICLSPGQKEKSTFSTR